MSCDQLLWTLGDSESKDGLQLIQGTPCVSQTTSTDHWHLPGSGAEYTYIFLPTPCPTLLRLG